MTDLNGNKHLKESAGFGIPLFVSTTAPRTQQGQTNFARLMEVEKKSDSMIHSVDQRTVSRGEIKTVERRQKCTHTHTHMYIYIYIYI
jgi:hypothetical protein